MKKLLVFVLLAAMACSKNDSSVPSDHMSEYEQQGLMMDIVHYAAKLPPGSTRETRYDKKFDEYYRNVAADYKWLAMRERGDGGYYFLISRPARSRIPMVEGIGGSFKIEKDSLVEYDEVFRTWKMVPENFEPKGKMLFDRMVTGKDLSIYYPQFGGDQYIEFPNGRIVFDKKKRRWVDDTAPVTEMDTTSNE